MQTQELRALAVAGKLAHNAEAGKGTSGLPAGEGWIAEPKYDGWRILAFVDDDGVTLFSRTGKTYNGKLPAVEAELAATFPPGSIIDGEAVALRVEGAHVVNEWGTTQSVLTKIGGHAAADKVTFMVFDLIAHRGIDARSLPFVQRRKLLERIFENEDEFDALALTVQLPATEQTYAALVAQGFEGAIFKRLTAPYASGKRGMGQVKGKASDTVDVIVMGFKPGQNGFEGMVGAVIFGQHDGDGNLVERGKCSGMDMRTRLDMTNRPERWLGTVIEVAHMGVSIGQTESGRFRHPQFKRQRKDKTPEQVLLHDK